MAEARQATLSVCKVHGFLNKPTYFTVALFRQHDLNCTITPSLVFTLSLVPTLISEFMAKKDKKSKTAEQKARVAAKQSKKATQKEKKHKSKGNDDSDADDVDVESVLEEYAKRVSKP